MGTSELIALLESYNAPAVIVGGYGSNRRWIFCTT